MKVNWMNHTGFVVSDMERSLAFYRDLLGLQEERNAVLEGEFISQVLGYHGLKLHVVYLGNGDMKHSVELMQYLDPEGGRAAPKARNDVGSTHMGVIVDDLDSLYSELLARGVKFVNPPAVRPDAEYPWARKAWVWFSARNECRSSIMGFRWNRARTRSSSGFWSK